MKQRPLLWKVTVVLPSGGYQGTPASFPFILLRVHPIIPIAGPFDQEPFRRAPPLLGCWPAEAAGVGASTSDLSGSVLSAWARPEGRGAWR